MLLSSELMISVSLYRHIYNTAKRKRCDNAPQMQIYLCRKSKRTWRFPWDLEGRSLILFLRFTVPWLDHSLQSLWIEVSYIPPSLEPDSYTTPHLIAIGKTTSPVVANGAVLTGQHHLWIYVKASEAKEIEGTWISHTLGHRIYRVHLYR